MIWACLPKTSWSQWNQILDEALGARDERTARVRERAASKDWFMHRRTLERERQTEGGVRVGEGGVRFSQSDLIGFYAPSKLLG